MAQDKISHVYATALLEIAEAGSALENTVDELQTILAVLTANPIVWGFFGSPLFKPEQKLPVLEKVFKKAVSPLIYNFLGTLIIRRRLDHLPDIQKTFAELVDVKLGRSRVQVYTAVSLSDAQSAELKKTLEAYLKSTVILDTVSKPDLIGGMIIRSGDVVIDSSLRSALENMKHTLGKQKIFGEDYYEN